MRRGARNLALLAVLLLLGGARRSIAPAAAATLAKLKAIARAAGFPEAALDTAAAVAMAESGGVASAKGDDGKSIGLWQVNLPSHPQYTEAQLLDAATNAKAALAISKNGTDWTPWTQFRNGAFRQYMPT